MGRTSSAAASAPAEYRQRYLDLLDEKELADQAGAKRIAEVASLLERMARAVTAAGERDLARRIEELCTGLKSRPMDPGVSRQLATVRDRLLQFMDGRDRDAAAMLSALGQCVDQLDGLAQGWRLRGAVKRLRKAIGKDDMADAAKVAELGAVQKLVLDSLAPAGRSDPSESPAQAPRPETVASTQEALPRGAAAEVGVRHPGNPDPASSVDRTAGVGTPMATVDWEAVGEVLRSMLDALEVPKHLREEAATLQERLKLPLYEAAAVAALQRLQALIEGCLLAMRHEFRGFLDGVDRRLDELLLAVGGTGELVREASGQRRAITGAMQAQLSQFRSEALAAGDLEGLKRSIEGHLEKLSENLTTLGTQDHAGTQTQEAQLEAMRERLRELESESAEARRALETQRRLALTDPLTGIANRLGFDNRVEEITGAGDGEGAPAAGPFTVAMVDIDHFKRVNDTHGHDAGDRALCLVANILRSRVRATDICARFGGEEFVVLFCGADAFSSARVVEQVRGFLKECGFNYKGQHVLLTASFGVAQLGDGESIDAALRRADKALYQAKHEGRNRVVVAG
jgi:diguanylate cyclase